MFSLRLQANMREGEQLRDHDNDVPAFPQSGDVFTGPGEGNIGPQSQWGMGSKPGMSLRDYFAAHAPPMPNARKPQSPTSADDIARWAYQYADAMLRRREQ